MCSKPTIFCEKNQKRTLELKARQEMPRKTVAQSGAFCSFFPLSLLPDLAQSCVNMTKVAGLLNPVPSPSDVRGGGERRTTQAIIGRWRNNRHLVSVCLAVGSRPVCLLQSRKERTKQSHKALLTRGDRLSFRLYQKCRLAATGST